MKRMVFSIMLLSLVSMAFVQSKGNGDGVQKSLDALTSKVAKLESMLKKVESEKVKDPDKKISSQFHNQFLNKAKDISKFLYDQFKFFVDKGDKVISKKFFVGATMILGPLVLLYSKIFGVNLVAGVINKLTALVVRGGTKTATNVAVSAIDTVSGEVTDNPWAFAKIIGTWVGISALGSITSQAISSLALEIGPAIVPVGSTAISYVTNPWALLITVPAFIAHRYYHH